MLRYVGPEKLHLPTQVGLTVAAPDDAGGRAAATSAEVVADAAKLGAESGEELPDALALPAAADASGWVLGLALPS